MASKLSGFSLPDPITSSLLKNPPDAVPPIDELERLHMELKRAKDESIERGRKAKEDLKTLQESMRRMTEKEKGKSKAVDKVKREHEFTPLPEADDSRSSSSYIPGSSKSRANPHPVNPIPSSSRSSLDPRRSMLDDAKKKKKKRKREGGDSDVESELARPHKISPPAVQAVPHITASKTSKPTIPSSTPQNKVLAGPDFSVPPSQQLLPPRPPIPPPPIPGPSKPTEVAEDFSKAKQPSTQVLVSTFYTSIEPYIRNIKEEDVGFLEYTGDEVEPYVMPRLGRHYLDVWEDQDMGLLPPVILGEPQTAPPSSFAAPTPKWDPSTLSEPDLVVEEKGHGLLTERVISALLPIQDPSGWKGVKAAEDAMEGRPGGSGAAAARRERLNVTDLEARIRDTMRYHGLLDAVPDFTEKVDDPIATALREAQRELRRVVATNKARKVRLVGIARDRLGYQEYLEIRDSIDRNITNLYAKLQKKDAPKLSKKKKKPLQGAAAAAAAAAAANAAKGSAAPEDAVPTLAPCPAALGLTPDEDNHLTVNEQLKQLIDTRRQWVDTVGSIFEEKEMENPGRIYGLPKESVYAGIDEEVEASITAQLASSSTAPSQSTMSGSISSSTSINGMQNGHHSRSLTNGSYKGKERARNNAMDIG
ncbi:hypothetical protein BDN70DRAFT_877080 [Pholiota conissans]|uniref:Uncharacterized protein n=1 Tax=Pholiota conissans TaxID=109636 RepID=A0A9P6D2P9_9AGAR|nr:hypothetical protein BDN70DRAFT_877080 [Pholiota conissans]